VRCQRRWCARSVPPPVGVVSDSPVVESVRVCQPVAKFVVWAPGPPPPCKEGFLPLCALHPPPVALPDLLSARVHRVWWWLVACAGVPALREIRGVGPGSSAAVPVRLGCLVSDPPLPSYPPSSSSSSFRRQIPQSAGVPKSPPAARRLTPCPPIFPIVVLPDPRCDSVSPAARRRLT